MNRKKFLKEINSLAKAKVITHGTILNLLKEKDSIFNNEDTYKLIEENLEKIIDGRALGYLSEIAESLYEDDHSKSLVIDSIPLLLEKASDSETLDLLITKGLNAHIKKYINSNMDSVLENYDMGKIVEIFNEVEFTQENIEKLETYFQSHKKEFIKKFLVSSFHDLSKTDEEKEKLVNVVNAFLTKLLEVEGARITDIKAISRGSFSLVVRVGDYVLKIGKSRKTFDIPNNERILQPWIRVNVADIDARYKGIDTVIEIAPVVEPIDIHDWDEDRLYDIYKEVREKGIVMGDFKVSNLGILRKDNISNYNPTTNPGMHGNVETILHSGDCVLLDTDFVYREDDPNIILDGELSLKFEHRYQSEKANKKAPTRR